MFHLKTIKFGGIDWGNDGLGKFYAEGISRVERVERVEGERIFNAEAQRRRVRRGDGRVEHVERVEGESVSQGAPSLRDGAKKGECSHQ